MLMHRDSRCDFVIISLVNYYIVWTFMAKLRRTLRNFMWIDSLIRHANARTQARTRTHARTHTDDNIFAPFVNMCSLYTIAIRPQVEQRNRDTYIVILSFW